MKMNKLDAGLQKLGVEPSDRQMQMLSTYINELEVWNSRLNLVSVKDHEELIVRHILDCLAGLDVIKTLKGKTVADIGSGAGLPGFLMAIFLEDREFTLVERSGKKAGFLRSTSALLKLVDRVTVVDTDLKNVSEKFDIVVLRAFREFGDFYSRLKAITSDGGYIAAYKGRMNLIEMDLSDAGLLLEDVEIKRIEVPFLDEERHMLLISG